MTLLEYIKVNYKGSKSDFAKSQGVKLPQITQWLNKKFIVVDGVLHSPRRDLDNGDSIKTGSTSKSVTMNFLNNELELLLDTISMSEKYLQQPDQPMEPYNLHKLIRSNLDKVIELHDVLYQLGYTDDEFSHFKCFDWDFRNDQVNKVIHHGNEADRLKNAEPTFKQIKEDSSATSKEQQSKRDLIKQFREQVKKLDPLSEKPDILQLQERDKEVFLMAEKLLLDNPILINSDCCGRGMPSYKYVYLSQFWQFKINDELKEALVKIDYLSKLFKDETLETE